MTAWLRRRFEEQRTTELLGLVRVIFAALLIEHGLRLALGLYRNGYFADFFHLPLLSPGWLPTKPEYIALLGLQLAAASLALAGIAARPALLAAALIGLYLLACDRLQYHNNRYTLQLFAWLLAFAPCDRSFRLFRKLPATQGPFWAVRLLMLQVSAIYLSSGGGKLFDADWRGGQVMLVRCANTVNYLQARGYTLPAPLIDLLHSAIFAAIASKVAICTELFLAFGLLHPSTRAFALWIGVLFHSGIQLFAQVEIFSVLMLGAYVLYATPELRERRLRYDPERRSGRLCSRVVPWLDWLMRFRIVAEPASGQLAIVDRQGRTHRGLPAFSALARAIPLLFPLWVPSALLAWLATPASPAREPLPPSAPTPLS